MCGRTCCTLPPKSLPFACTVVTKSVPKWREAPCGGGHYQPSTNIPPTAYTPILLKNSEQEVFLQPMLWGLVPPWHHGESALGHRLTTNNARLEGLCESKLYTPALKADRRCVIVCDGFYEWKKTKEQKQPYLVFANQEENNDAAAVELFAQADVDQFWDEDKGCWTGPRPLFMAGIYSIWYSESDRSERLKPVFSYSVITRESNDTLSWLHERMPAILSTPESVSAWLDPNVHGLDALKVLQGPVEKNEVTWYPVSKEVGSVKNKDSNLCAKVDLDATTGTAVSKSDQKAKSFMANWLSSGTKRAKNLTEEDNDHCSSSKSAKK